MRRQNFVAWLKAHPKQYSYSVITGYPTECSWVEKSLGVDLDSEYDRDGLASVQERLKYRDDHPLRGRIAGDPSTNLATYRRAIASYRNFRNEQPHLREAVSAPPLPATRAAVTGVSAAPSISGEPIRPNFLAGPSISAQPPAVASNADPAAAAPAIGADLDRLVQGCKVSELLALHAVTLEQLRSRGIVRSANTPGSDYAELLFTRAFGWTRNGSSAIDYDATDWSGRRYQIKSRLLEAGGSRQLGALRRLPEQGFDYLAAVLFERDYKVAKAAMIPHEIVAKYARFQEHTNSWIFILNDSVWQIAGVGDVTPQLQQAATELDLR